MVVVDQRDAEVAGALAELGHQLPETAVVVGDDGAALRPLVDDLHKEPARVAHELRVTRRAS